MARTKSPKKNDAKDQTVTNNATSVNASTSLPKITDATAPAGASATQTRTATAAPATASPANTSAEPRRLEIVKPDSRSNIVPINLEDEIRALAYELSARRGFIPGYENEDWLTAEREIRQRYHQRSA